MLPDQAYGVVVIHFTQGATAAEQFLKGFLYIVGDIIKTVTEHGQNFAGGKLAVQDRLLKLFLGVGSGLTLRCLLALPLSLLPAPFLFLPLFLFPLSLRLTG
jgi:hypothetical protein